jgi:hypothetical protein
VTTRWRPSVSGVVVGAAVGGIGRAAVVALHLTELTSVTAPIVLVAAAIGAAIGALAGLVGRALLGALVGAALTALVFALTLPIAFLVTSVGAGTMPSIVATIGIGAVSGLAGGVAARRAAANERWPARVPR